MPHGIREQRIRQRLTWFRKAQELRSVTDACVFFGISRKTYYKWRHRYAASGWDRLNLADRSRRPHRHPRQVGTRMARRLRRRTGYGARRLAWHLRRKGVPHVPSVYGIHRVLQRAGLLTKHRTRPKHRQRYVMPRPGDCVQVDIKVCALQGRGAASVPGPPRSTTAPDSAWSASSRSSRTARGSRSWLPSAARSHFGSGRSRRTTTPPSRTGTMGAPKTAPDKPVRLHPFTLACAAAGIQHRTIRPRSPHLNGKVERSHRIDTEECSRSPRCRSFGELVKAHRRFNQFYNTARPHGGHEGLTPLERLRQFAPYQRLRRLYL